MRSREFDSMISVDSSQVEIFKFKEVLATKEILSFFPLNVLNQLNQSHSFEASVF